MSKKIIIANWKMSPTLQETKNLTQEILNGLKEADLENTDVVFCPSFTALKSINDIIKKNNLPVFLGAQNVFWQEKGAYTGEISPLMLKELGVKYIIIGHSERRINLKETDEMVNQKLKIALDHDFIPIFCVGETFEERKFGNSENVVKRQLLNALDKIKLTDKSKMIIVYEPVWAIGTGQSIEPEKAELMNLVIKKELMKILGAKIAENNVKIIYGGSVNSNNIKSFLEKNITGFLVGGASLKSSEFIKIVLKE